MFWDTTFCCFERIRTIYYLLFSYHFYFLSFQIGFKVSHFWTPEQFIVINVYVYLDFIMFKLYLICFIFICFMFYFKLSFIIRPVYNVLALLHMLNTKTVASTLNSQKFHYFLPVIHFF